jgi:putative hydrolase of the HAD superfamily
VRFRAVLLDVLGTLVRLEPPAERLSAALESAAGAAVSQEAAERAVGAEIAYYVQHHLEGRDPDSLADLRRRCAAAMLAELRAAEPALPDISASAATQAMMASLVFTPFRDAVPALRELRRRGLRLVAVSNWDCSLSDYLAAAGLLELLDGAVHSAGAGEAKPAAAVFLAGLEQAGVESAEAVHVGDSVQNDVAGAAAVGIAAILLSRNGALPAEEHPGPRPHALIRTLEELPSLT